MVRVLPGLRDSAVVPDVAVVGKAVCHISRESEMVLSSIEEVQYRGANIYDSTSNAPIKKKIICNIPEGVTIKLENRIRHR
jgi:hypothetical protein